jgi:hypothetical protein
MRPLDRIRRHLGKSDQSSGGAIAGAVVEVQVAASDPCDGAADWGHTKDVTTDPNGNYSLEMKIGNASGVRCVRVTEVASGTSERDAVEFVGGCEETRPPGQLNLNLVIP